VADGAHYQSISVADGIVYSFDGNGFLDGFAAGSGTPLLRRPLAADTGTPMGGVTSGGIAIAEHAVVVAATSESAATGAITGSGGTGPGSGAYLIAYRPASLAGLAR
jgi:hypothetical protein